MVLSSQSRYVDTVHKQGMYYPQAKYVGTVYMPSMLVLPPSYVRVLYVYKLFVHKLGVCTQARHVYTSRAPRTGQPLSMTW